MAFWLLSIYFRFEAMVFKCYQRTGCTVISHCGGHLWVWSFSTITATESGTESTRVKEQHRDQKRYLIQGAALHMRRTQNAEWLLGTTKGGNSWKHSESTEELVHMETNVALQASSDTCTSCTWDHLLASASFQHKHVWARFYKTWKVLLSWTFHLFREYYPWSTIPFPGY